MIRMYVDVVVVEATQTGAQKVAAFQEAWPNLTFTLITETGPAGGWPEIEVVGKRQDVIQFLQSDYCDSWDDVEDLIATAQPI